MLQQGRLADPCLAPEHQHAALAGANSRYKAIQLVALANTVEQPQP
jgi:hypothetical protein